MYINYSLSCKLNYSPSTHEWTIYQVYSCIINLLNGDIKYYNTISGISYIYYKWHFFYWLK